MKTFLSLLVVIFGSAAAYFGKHYLDDYSSQESLSRLASETQMLKGSLETKEKELIGYTKYTTYITTSKQALSGQMKLLAATITRAEGVTQVIERNFLPNMGLSSTGTVAIWYSAEYAFGFDLKPEKYDIRTTPSGIEIVVGKPALVATPAVSNLRHKVLAGGMFTDEKAAALKLHEQAAATALRQGKELAQDPAVIALCEKKLIEFLRSFLAKQPGVTKIPDIRVVYR